MKPRGNQRGFTLVELIIVVVIIGILSAVAVPSLTGTTDEATKAKNTAILGALKGAWSAAYVIAKTAPSASQVANQMNDPACSASGTTITCDGADTTFFVDVAVSDPQGNAASAASVTTTKAIKCTTATKCL